MRFVALALIGLLSLLFAPSSIAWAEDVHPVHGLAMHGALKYPPGFKAFDYVNPDAPKGGEVRLYGLGSFDSLNPFIVKGEAPAGIAYTYATLLTSSADEPFSSYGLVAESLEVPADRSWVIFNLRKEARFHDGTAITADDVIFSFNILRAQGQPSYRIYYGGVVKVEKLGERRVKFTFAPGDNRELPLILGQLPVLSQAYWAKHQFDQTTLEPPLGSGPYQVDSFEAGRFLRLKRVETWWGKDLGVARGFYNFAFLRWDYYRDTTVALEAFKAGDYDFRVEGESKKWATAYDFPALSAGLAIKRNFSHQRPTGLQAFAFNIRRDLFKDRRVREALTLAFDFEWSNKTLFYGQYRRAESYFNNSDLASRGLPSPEELKILEPYRGRIPDEIFTKSYEAPKTDGSGNPRDNLRQAAKLLQEAGWQVKDGKLVDGTGKPFVFELLLSQPMWERIALPFAKNLEKLGITMSLRTVDSAQYGNRTNSFDYDMIVDAWGETESPGNEQAEFWGSAAARIPGSHNAVGISDPVIDELIAKLIASPTREDLVTRTRALDRVLLWGYYVIPHWYRDQDFVAYWNKFGMPNVLPTQGLQFDAWWVLPNSSSGSGSGKKPPVAAKP